MQLKDPKISSKLVIVDDFTKFVNILGNRPVKENKELKDTVNDVGQICSVIVVEQNNKYLVVDGQHRIQECKILGYKVKCEVVDYDKPEDLTMILNYARRNWPLKQFIEWFANAGNQNYIDYKKAMSDYPYLDGRAIIDWVCDQGHSSVNEVIKSGKLQFSLSKKDKLMLSNFNSLNESIVKERKVVTISILCRALYRISNINGFELSYFQKKFPTLANEIICTTPECYLSMVKIYNKNLRTDKNKLQISI
jgi:hypothetical protein